MGDLVTRAIITGRRGSVGSPTGSKFLVKEMRVRYTFTIVSVLPELLVTREGHRG
ncbi:MAG: hypothetical protein WCK40_06740 [Thermoleophilia bacterium]